MSQAFGERIRRFRMEKGYTQVWLAAQLHVTKQAVSKWENGITCPDIFLLPQLARTLEVTLDDLLCG